MQDDEKSILLARVAERAERYDEMADYMKERVNKGGALNNEERDMFSAAFKGSLNGRRMAVRTAKMREDQEQAVGNATNANLASGYRSKVEAELQKVCEDVINLLKSRLVLTADSAEAKVFYLKMQGDYYRYMSEFTSGDHRSRATEEARQAYTAAVAEAEANLPTTHPVRLGLALNFAVFQHEVLGDTANAIAGAKKALQDASTDAAQMPEESQRDAMITMQLLGDNLALWEPAA